jgi:hypothetical protein
VQQVHVVVVVVVVVVVYQHHQVQVQVQVLLRFQLLIHSQLLSPVLSLQLFAVFLIVQENCVKIFVEDIALY